MRKQFKIKHLPTPVDPHQATPKTNVDEKFDNPILIKNTGHVDFNIKDFDNVRFVKVT